MRILTERATWSPEVHSLALAGIDDSDAFVKRNAAAGLGAHPDVVNVAPLLNLRHHVPAEDTHLLHGVRMALRDQLQLAGVWKTLASLSEKDSRAVADVCLGVHDTESAQFLQRHLERYAEPLPIMQNQAHYIARFGMEGSGAWVLKWVRERFPKDLNVQGQVLRTVHQATQERDGKMDAADLAMAEDVTVRLLASRQVGLGVELAGLFKLTKTQGTLLSVINNAKANKNIRKNAVIALLAIDAKGNTAALASLINSQDEAIEVREQIAGSLAGTNLPDAHAALVKALEAAPARLQTTIALGLAGSPHGGEKLLEAVTAGKASARLLQEPAIAIRLGQAKIADLSSRVAKLTKGLPTADQRLQDLLGRRRDGYHKAQAVPGIGLKVFEKHCAACHQIANKGAKIGPQLDGVGIRGLERLLEDTLDPNRNVDQAFRTTTLVLTNGQLVNGLFLRQDGTILVLADNAGKEIRVPAVNVQERLVSPLSPMPGNFAELIPEDDFNHLLAYLLAQRTKK
jgi:putative heme-binding domain-containing protein